MGNTRGNSAGSLTYQAMPSHITSTAIKLGMLSLIHIQNLSCLVYSSGSFTSSLLTSSVAVAIKQPPKSCEFQIIFVCDASMAEAVELFPSVFDGSLRLRVRFPVILAKMVSQVKIFGQESRVSIWRARSSPRTASSAQADYRFIRSLFRQYRETARPRSHPHPSPI